MLPVRIPIDLAHVSLLLVCDILGGVVSFGIGGMDRFLGCFVGTIPAATTGTLLYPAVFVPLVGGSPF
eukprot:3413402-Prorocentrum_lima.AAC.1